ncbi:diguanylate cyclase, partial [Thermus scotoductus]
MALLYTAAALASFLVGLLLGLLGYPGPHVLPWFMIAVAVVASVHGLPWGLLASALAASALALFPQFSGVALALLLLSALLAHQVGKSLRRAHRRARSLARVERLLASALEALPQAEDREALLKSLPERLFALGERGHVGVWV